MNYQPILRNFRRLLTLTLCLAGFNASGANWFVAPNGSDAAAGTLQSPFASLSRALSQASSGDTVYLRAGIYQESIVRGSWHPQNITIAAYQNESVTLQPPAGSAALSLSGVNGFSLRGLRFLGGHVGISSGSSNIDIDACTFESLQSGSAFAVHSATNLTIRSCFFVNNRAASIVGITGTNDRLVIRDSVFFDNYHPTGAVTQSTIILVGQNPANFIRIENNLFAMTTGKESRPDVAPGGGASAIMINSSEGGNFSTPRIAVVGNTIQNYRFRGTIDDTDYDPTYLKNPAQGGEQGNGISIVDSSRLEVARNRILNSSGYGIIGFRTTYLSIRDNEIRDCGKNGIFIAGTGHDAVPNLIAENRIYNCGWVKGGTSGISTIVVGSGNLILRNFVSGQRNGLAGQVGGNWFGDGNGILADRGSPGTIIIGNVVVENEGAGISVNQSSDSVVLHNTVVSNGSMPHRSDNSGILVAGDGAPSDRIHIANNLLYNNRLGQLWIWKTALDHSVQYNLYAPGPLTAANRINTPIDWFNNRYSVAQWLASPPRPGNGMGALGARPVFLGDLIGGNPREELLYYLPVQGSAGTGDAQSAGAFAMVQPPPGMPGVSPLGQALAGNPQLVQRPFNNANRGALEPSSEFVPIRGGGWLAFGSPSPNDAFVWAGHLGSWLEHQNGITKAEGFGQISAGGGEGWLSTEFHGLVYFGAAQAGDGWLWGQRFGWMRFANAGGGQRLLWANDLQTWVQVLPNGSFLSFDFGLLTPIGGFNRYRSDRIGDFTTGDFGGWVASDRFGFVWAARGTNGVWFYSTDRQDWIGVVAPGMIWSTKEQRFL